jgi:hypothetical protein
MASASVVRKSVSIVGKIEVVKRFNNANGGVSILFFDENEDRGGELEHLGGTFLDAFDAINLACEILDACVSHDTMDRIRSLVNRK